MENHNQNQNNQQNDPTKQGGARNSSEEGTTAGKNSGASADTATGNCAAGATTGADDMLKLMEQSDKTCMLGQWMKCMRKPALSVRYTLDKRHIPDMDSVTTDQCGCPSQGSESAPIKGSNADVMTTRGGFTIRYFDLASGMLTVLAAACLLKGYCCLKKHL